MLVSEKDGKIGLGTVRLDEYCNTERCTIRLVSEKAGEISNKESYEVSLVSENAGEIRN
jgi:hypothetical protein